MSEFIDQNHDPAVCSLYEMHFTYKNAKNLKEKIIEKKMTHANSKYRKAGVVILILNKTDFKVENNKIKRNI